MSVFSGVKLFITFVARRLGHCSAWIISFARKWNNFRVTILQFQSNDFAVISSVFLVVFILEETGIAYADVCGTDRLTACCITWLITNYWLFQRLLPFAATSRLLHIDGGRNFFIRRILWKKLTVLLSVVGLARRQMCLFPSIFNEWVWQVRTQVLLMCPTCSGEL
jgi:hypothetical protein